MQNELLLTILIPAFNEEGVIYNCLKRTEDYLKAKKITYQIVVVDDDSRDRTSEIVKDYIRGNPLVKLLKNNTNEGKGAAIRKGVLHAENSKYILFLDADFSTPIEEAGKILFWIDKGFDVVIATRRVPESEVEDSRSLLRKLLSRGFNFLSNLLLLKGEVSDVTCGFKCFSFEAAQSIFKRQRLNSWAFDAEILYISQIAGFKIKEVPIHWVSFKNTHVVLIKDIVKSFKELIDIKINHWRGKYD